MKRKFTFLLMALLALAGFKSWGQTEIQIGNGTQTQANVPFYSYYKYSYTQMLYLGSEIGESGTITSISFNNSLASSLTGMNFDIYMMCVSKDSYSDAGDWVLVTNGDLVCSTTLNTISQGWVTFILDTPFQYDNTQGNLMIAFDNNTGACTDYGKYPLFYCTSTSPKNTCILQYSDGTNVDPTSPSDGNGISSQRPNIKITMEPSASCPAPTGLTASNITATGATISWTDNGAESYDLAYGVASTFDLINPATYTIENTTNTSVLLSGLTAETEYKCAVKAHCSEEESAWSSAVAFLPSAFQHLTVNDGTYVNTNNDSGQVPFNGYNADNNYNKSQFVIPASALEQMADASITDITFYLNTSSSNKEYTYDIFDIYVKEVDYTTVGYTYPEEFASMTKVYTGKLTTSNYQLTIHFDEPYVYGGQNLMVGFNQTSRGTWGYTYWLGKEEGTEMRSRSGYSNSYGSTVNSYTFLPKTTFTYLPGATYKVTVIPSEHGVITADPTTDVSAGTTVSLSATPNTGYVFLGEWTVTNNMTSEAITVIDNQFTMPDSDVTVTATFEALVPHTVTIADNIQHGTVELAEDDPEGYYVGETIFLTVTPDEGYFYPNEDEITVTDDSGNPIDVTITEDHQYSFTMPNSDVTVTAEFNMYYMVNFDEEMLGGSIGATSDWVHFDQHPYFKDGTYVYFVPNSDEDYEYVEESILVYKGDSTEGESVEVDFSSGLARITMPDTDIFVTATFNKVKFAVTQQNVNPMGSGSYSVNPTSHVAGNTSVYISNINPSDDYQFASVVVTRNDNQAAVETYAYYGDYVFYMPDSDVTVTVNFEEKPYYNVTVGTVTNGTVSVEDTTSFWAGVTVWLNVQPLSGDYILESITATPKEGDPITPTHKYGNYYTFTMPASNVEITATFRAIQSYTINYYVNGELDRTMQCREDGLVNNDGPQNVAVPAGMTYEGWGVAEIGTYVTEKPAVLGNAESPTQNCDLYAVLSYSESVPASSKSGETWVEVTSPSDLSSGDQVIIVKKSSNVVMCDRSSAGSGSFEKATISISNNEITSLPSNAVILTAIDNGGNWKFSFTDAHTGPTTLADYMGGYLLPQNAWGGYDTWTIEQNGSSVALLDPQYNAYASFYSGYFTCVTYTYYKAELFKLYKPTITTNYYMTSVLTNGEIAENTTAKNIIISSLTSINVKDGATLTMDANGLFRNENAANFVFEDGAQLIYDGDETVNATMKKDITGTDWYTISSPLANSVEFAEVENLIPSSGVTGTDYDLYRFDEANSIWVNSRVWQDNEPNTTIIANPNFKTIDKGLGYIYANEAGAELEFKGEINVADVENVNLTMTADKGKGFNLIGNPFTQSIELANVTGVTLAEGFYVLSNEGDWGSKLTSSPIKPLQGFLVQATTAGQATISKHIANKGERSGHNTNIEMIVSNSNHRDNAYAVFGEGIGLNKVNHRNAEAPMLYVPQDGEKFAIAFMDENTTVFPLNFKAMTTGKYSISLKATDDINTLVLIDNMTGTETNMLLEESYSFNGSPADSDGRFTVKLSISHSNGQADNEHFVYQNGKELVVNGEGSLQIFDVLGRVVISEEVHGQTVYVGNLSEGAYIVRMTGNEVKTQKIIIR